MGTIISADDIKEASSDWNLKEVKEILGIVKDIFGAKQQQQEAPVSKLHGSPRVIQDNKNLIPHEVAKPMQVDTGQLKIFISDLISVHALKLPEDIKEMQVKDLIGDNFDDLKVKHMGISVSPEDLIDGIVDNSAKALNHMLIEK